MLDVILLLVIAFASLKLSQMAHSSKKQEDAKPEVVKVAPKVEALPPMRLNIPEVTPFRGEIPSWIKGYGISRDRVMAAGTVSGPRTLESLPIEVRGALSEIYEAGSGMGLRLMELVTGQDKLQDDEYLWFVVVMRGTPQIHAFVSNKSS